MPILNIVDVSEIVTTKDAHLALNNQYNKINHQANMRLTDKSISDKERALWTAVAKRCDNDRESAMELKQMKFDGVQIY